MGHMSKYTVKDATTEDLPNRGRRSQTHEFDANLHEWWVSEEDAHNGHGWKIIYVDGQDDAEHVVKNLRASAWRLNYGIEAPKAERNSTVVGFRVRTRRKPRSKKSTSSGTVEDRDQHQIPAF